MEIVCETCGDRGFEEALLYCGSCKIQAVHRYCMGITPVPFTEHINWICEDCDGSDREFDFKEAGEATKLRDILKKSVAKEKKSNNHTPPNLTLEDHEFKDATNVEPVEGCSSAIKEVTEESKRRQSSESRKPNELTALATNGESVSEVEMSSSVPNNTPCTSKRNDGGSDQKEVDQIANLKHISEKSEKTDKKEKSKRRQSSDRKPNELNVLVTNEVSVSEVEKSSSVPNNTPCTSKRNDGGSDQKEVDQIANLRHTSKKSEKTENKEKSKRRHSSDRKLNELNVLVTNEASVSEAEKSSSVPNNTPCTSKRNDGGSDQKEVDQIANLRHISKKSEKTENKEKSKRRHSSDRKPNELNVLLTNEASVSEVEKLSSVPNNTPSTSKRNDGGSVQKEVDQITNLRHISKSEKTDKKEKSKRRHSSDRKPNELNVLVTNGVSVSEVEKSSSVPNNTPCTSKRNDGGCDQIANLRHISKTSEKTEKKEKSKRRHSSDRNPNELNVLVTNGASVAEVEKSSSVPNNTPCTSKRNDCGSDQKEVNQIANLRHISKKREKTEKEKKNKTNSNNSLPDLAEEDHEIHNATNVEPVKLSSSLTKQTMESKCKESPDNRKPLELTVLDGNGASVSEAKQSSSVPDHNACTTKKRKLSSRNIPFTSEKRQLADGNRSCKEVGPNMPQMSAGLTSRHYRARPDKTPVWRGLISVKGENICSLDGIVAHTSRLACPKVHETARSLQAHLSAHIFPRLEIWPKNFLKNGGPKDNSIALFFFPSSESTDEKVFHSLVLDMKNNDWAMRCMLDDAELLLFTSYMLPVDFWTSNSNGYLWGVFKKRRQTS